MSTCLFLASDHPLPSASPSKKYPLLVDLDKGTIYDGNADDNLFLFPFPDVDLYCEKQYGVSLEWNYTEGRANQLIAYIRQQLLHTDTVEFWHVWLSDYFEFEDRPYFHRETVSIAELTAAQIRTLDRSEIWNTPDKMYPDRPSFYCLTITRY